MVAPRPQTHAQAPVGCAARVSPGTSGELQVSGRRHLVFGDLRVLVAAHARRSRPRGSAAQHEQPPIAIAVVPRNVRPSPTGNLRTISVHARIVRDRAPAPAGAASLGLERARPHARRRFATRRQSRRGRHTQLWRRVQPTVDGTR